MKKIAQLLRFFLMTVIVIGSVFTAYNSSYATQGHSIKVMISGFEGKISKVFIKYKLTETSDELEDELTPQNAENKQFNLDKQVPNKPVSLTVVIITDKSEKEFVNDPPAQNNEGNGTLVYKVEFTQNGDPGNGDPGTEDPGNGDPGTGDPGTENPGTGDPGTENPGTQEPGAQNPDTKDPGTGNNAQQPGSNNAQQPATNNEGTVHNVTKTVSGGKLPDTAGPWMNWLLLSGFLAVGSAATLFKFRKQ
ncbi:hypothetical protein [Bacillus sp. FJAT-29814]|uniref:hypothetical protein n=1 Tax=Bacillus sp. FJAT-29814 TaxID=1729688 RepID=UPI00082970ED|nr:hypothetical protein [Bacillus sp. FJAT-29814]